MSLALLGTLLTWYDLTDVVTVIGRVSVPSFLLAVLLFAVGLGVSVAKWRLAIPNAAMWPTVRAYLGSLAVSLLPAGQLGGEISKLALAAEKGLGASSVAASIAYDKLTSLAGLCGLGAALAAMSSDRLALPVAIVFLLGGSALLACVMAAPAVARAVPVLRSSTILGGLHRVAASIGELAKSNSLLARSLLLGVVSQGVTLLIYAIMARSLGLDLAIVDLLWAVAAANVATVVPVSVAGLGVREFGLVALLARHDVAGEQAIALSLSCFGIFLIGAAAGIVVQLLPSARRGMR